MEKRGNNCKEIKFLRRDQFGLSEDHKKNAEEELKQKETKIELECM